MSVCQFYRMLFKNQVILLICAIFCLLPLKVESINAKLLCGRKSGFVEWVRVEEFLLTLVPLQPICYYFVLNFKKYWVERYWSV